jgi:hypothetical protein
MSGRGFDDLDNVRTMVDRLRGHGSPELDADAP